MYQAKTWMSMVGISEISGSLSLGGAVRQLCRATGYALDDVYTGVANASRWNVFRRMVGMGADNIIGVIDFVDLTAP